MHREVVDHIVRTQTRREIELLAELGLPLTQVEEAQVPVIDMYRETGSPLPGRRSSSNLRASLSPKYSPTSMGRPSLVARSSTGSISERDWSTILNPSLCIVFTCRRGRA
jgi:hypothetical protein